MIYNTVYHDIRNQAGLSILDFCILEIIYNLSTSGKEMYSSWCNASKSNFCHLASSRTIINRFNHLEADGWLEFKDEKRFLKRTTDKYFERVMCKIIGVKKLHSGGEKISPITVKGIHSGGEKISPLGVKEFHSGGENNSPNKNINKNIEKYIYISLKDENENLKKENQILKNQIAELKKQLSEKREKSSAKKEKSSTLFPDLSGSKTYVTHDKRSQKDKNELRPFSHNDKTARLTLESLFPLDNVELKKQYFDSYGIQLSDAQINHARNSFIQNLSLMNKLVMINHVNEFKRMFFHWWIEKDLKYQSRNQNQRSSSKDSLGISLDYDQELDKKMRSKYS